jgi:hypothetical protein
MAAGLLRLDPALSRPGQSLAHTERERGFVSARPPEVRRGSVLDRQTMSASRQALLADIDAYTAVRDINGQATGRFRPTLQIHATKEELWAVGGSMVRENPHLRDAASVIAVFKDSVAQPVRSPDGSTSIMRGAEGLNRLKEDFGPERHPNGAVATRTLHLDRDKMVERVKSMPEDLLDMTKDFLKSLMMMNGRRMKARSNQRGAGLFAQILGAVEQRPTFER